MDTFFKEINKYVVSIFLFFAGLSFLIKYLSGDNWKVNLPPCFWLHWP